VFVKVLGDVFTKKDIEYTEKKHFFPAF